MCDDKVTLSKQANSCIWNAEHTVKLEQTTSLTVNQVVRFQSLDQLAPLADAWDRLARGVPFRSWAWASNWWRHYGNADGKSGKSGDSTSLFTLGVLNGYGLPIGIAPWYVEHSASQGRVLRFIGSGEVCSDYLSVLCQPGMEGRVADALARWLLESHEPHQQRPGSRPDEWDLLELAGVDARDETVRHLAETLEAANASVYRQPGPNCWRIELPETWDQYLATLSKVHRKHIRRIQRRFFSTDRIVHHSVENLADLPRARDVLIDLHQRRWRSLGQAGCFASDRFAAFHRDVMPDLLRNGQLLLDWLELDGRPIAAEYHLVGNGVVYAYQGGIEPDAMEFSPGRLANMITIRRAIRQGYRGFDFLRGDEPYKARWRARPRESLVIRIVPDRPAARLRYNIWLMGENLKSWLKGGLRFAGE